MLIAIKEYTKNAKIATARMYSQKNIILNVPSVKPITFFILPSFFCLYVLYIFIIKTRNDKNGHIVLKIIVIWNFCAHTMQTTFTFF